MLIHLFTGSIKVLFSTNLNDNKFIVKSADTLFETLDAIFSVIRNPVLDLKSLCLKKRQCDCNPKYFESEMVSVKDNEPHSDSPIEMSYIDSVFETKIFNPRDEAFCEMTTAFRTYLHTSGNDTFADEKNILNRTPK